MAQPPWPIYASLAAQYLPLAGAAVRWRSLTRPRMFVLLWLLLYALMNAIGVYLATVRHANNHFLSYIFTPLQGASILWAFSLWQTRALPRLTMRLAIPFFVIAWAVFTLTIENVRNFSAAAEPVYCLLGLGAALYTLVTRSGDATEPITGQDWFWICGGLALHFSALAVVLPLAAGLLNTDVDVVTRAYAVRGVVNALAMVCIAIGFLCPKPLAHSGLSFSPAS